MVEITGSSFQKSCTEFMDKISAGKVGIVKAMDGRYSTRALRSVSLTLVEGYDGESTSMRDVKANGVLGMIDLINNGKPYVHARHNGMKVFKMEVVDV
jgi:hypothetical protein